MIRLAALPAALLLCPQSALAWGGLGHEAICELAFLELDDAARQRVIALIQQDQEFTTFRASCNWADRPRQRATEHFVNLPRDATGLDDNECPLARECVVSAIEHDFAVLASPDATDEEKLAALKFLGHWVGDIHQPLHAASQDDRGGNHVRTLGSSCGSLHTLWDSCIVEERLGMHPLAIVRELQAGITDEQRAEWLAGDVIAWANESFAIAREPDVGYCVMVDGTCQYAADNREFDDGEPERVVVVDDGYLDMHAPIARERIAMAAVRLAGLLNRALGSQSP
jgi:S1/P1 Nuclease